MKTHAWWIGAGIAVIAGLTWWTVHEPSPRALAVDRSPVSEPGPGVHSQVKALERVTRDLHARLDRAETLAPKQGPAQPASTPDEEAAVADEGKAALTRLTRDERNQLVVTSTLDHLEGVVGAEPVDRSWTTRAAAAVNENLSAAEFAGTRAAAVDCRVSVCRFLLRHESVEARERFQPALGTGAFRGKAFFHFDPTKNETVVYVAREGQPLPMPDLQEAALRLGR